MDKYIPLFADLFGLIGAAGGAFLGAYLGRFKVMRERLWQDRYEALRV